MHFSLAHALVITAFVGSLYLVFNRGDRLFPVIAAIASGLMVAITWNVISISSAKFRIDVILPAVLCVSAAICWGRMSAKAEVTAATAATLAGAVILAGALHALA